SRRRHTRFARDWSSDVCSSDLGGVDPSWIQWRPYDGIGRKVRNGLNFTERGFGVRGAVGVSDRGHTAACQLAPGDVDWDYRFGRSEERRVGKEWVTCSSPHEYT